METYIFPLTRLPKTFISSAAPFPTAKYFSSISFNNLPALIHCVLCPDGYCVINSVEKSFIDFANPQDRYTLINRDILEKYENLIVIKSISKSYGVPGIRLGVLATSNFDLLEQIKRRLAIWNINSYGEYYLQIANLYKKDYVRACDMIASERERFIAELRQMRDIVVYNSEANFLMCNLGEHNSTTVATELLNDDNIFIKDLRTKSAFEGENFVRLAVRTEEQNKLLARSLFSKLRGGHK